MTIIDCPICSVRVDCGDAPPLSEVACACCRAILIVPKPAPVAEPIAAAPSGIAVAAMPPPIVANPPMSGTAISGFIVGLVSIILPLGPIAVVLSVLGMRAASPHRQPARSGWGLALTGLILGSIWTVLHAALIPAILYTVRDNTAASRLRTVRAAGEVMRQVEERKDQLGLRSLEALRKQGLIDAASQLADERDTTLLLVPAGIAGVHDVVAIERTSGYRGRAAACYLPSGGQLRTEWIDDQTYREIEPWLDPLAQMRAAELAQRNGDLEGTITHARSALLLSDDAGPALCSLVSGLVDADRLDEARLWTERVEAKAAKQPVVAAAWAYLAARAHDAAGARAHLSDAERWSDTHMAAEIWSLVAEAKSSLDDLGGAVVAYRRYLERIPADHPDRERTTKAIAALQVRLFTWPKTLAQEQAEELTTIGQEVWDTDLSPDFRVGRYHRALALEAHWRRLLGPHLGGIPAMEEAGARYGLASVHFLIGAHALVAGDLENANLAAKQALAEAPKPAADQAATPPAADGAAAGVPDPAPAITDDTADDRGRLGELTTKLGVDRFVLDDTQAAPGYVLRHFRNQRCGKDGSTDVDADLPWWEQEWVVETTAGDFQATYGVVSLPGNGAARSRSLVCNRFGVESTVLVLAAGDDDGQTRLAHAIAEDLERREQAQEDAGTRATRVMDHLDEILSHIDSAVEEIEATP